MASKALILMLLIYATNVKTQDFGGKAFIGEDVNDTSTFFSFNQNDVTAFVPVYIGVFNDTTGDDIVTPNIQVDVTCEFVIDPSSGYTDASFQVDRILVQDVNAGVEFNNVFPGRPIAIQCWGESVSSSDLTFTKDSSMSAPVLFEIRPPGQANIPGGVVVAPNTDTVSRKSQFVVQLSEVVENDNVTVKCEAATTNVSMVVELTEGLVLIGKDRAILEVSVLEQNNGQVQVSCSAESLNNGPQFEPPGSTGEGALFILDEADVTLVPVVTTLTYPQMTAYLVLDAMPESEVTFYCNLTEVESLDEASMIRDSDYCEIPDDIASTRAPILNNTDASSTTPATGITTPSTTTPSPSVNTTSGVWQLSASTIDFISEDVRFKPVQITRTNRFQPDQPEMLLIKCCAPPELNVHPKYNNTKASFLAVTYISTEKPINWTAATPAEDLETETEVKDPAFVDFGPCPCDLTENVCDVNCCCDGDCTTEDTDLFTCIAGIEGGQEPEIPRHRCASQYANKPDWFPIMCTEFENNGFLGYFRAPINATRSNVEYTALASAYESFSYEETVVRFPDSIPEATEPYIEGYAVKTGIRSELTDSGVDVSNYFRLTLPQGQGKCLTTAPVRYLVDSVETCVLALDEDICVEFSQISSRIYAQSSNVWQNQAAPQVLRENAQTTITETNTNYYCLTDQEVQDYLAKTTTASEIYTKDQIYLFNTIPENFTDCGFNEQTGAYSCGDLEFQDNSMVFNYTRCAWDDGFTQAPAPELDNSANISVCNNSVVDVVYNFTWKGPEIELLTVTVLLGNLPLQVEKTVQQVIDYIDANGQPAQEINNITTISQSVLTQKFSTDWTHNVNESVNEDAGSDSENFIVTQRSGNPGYKFGMPVLSGVSVDNGTEFQYMDINSSKSLSLWDPAISGLCEGAGRSDIEFGVNALRSCMLRISLEQLKDCDNTRKLVLFQQDSLMNSSYISQGGNPNRTVLDRWIKILREDISSIIDSDNDTSTPDDLTTAPIDITTPTSIPELTTAFANTTDNVTETQSYVDGLVGRCPNMPEQINVDIMYALVGKVDNVPVYEIVGAKVSYKLSLWQLHCAGADGLACSEEALETAQAQVQTFTVQSSVNFIQVPPSPPEPQTEYQIRRARERGNGFVCKYDTCVEEALYPMSEGYARERRIYVFGCTFMTVLVLVAYVFVLKL